MNDLNFIVNVLNIFSKYDTSEDLFYRVDNGIVRFFGMCNDTFWWATADCEQITPENFEILETAFADLDKIGGLVAAGQATRLFAARIRKMRPQGAVYKYLDKELWPLFNACGPERTPSWGNPNALPEDL